MTGISLEDYEKILNRLSQLEKEVFRAHRETDRLSRALEEIKKTGKKKRADGVSEGSQVWEAYEEFMVVRYGHAPVRNAMTNRICSQLVQRVGLEDALNVVHFYVHLNDAYLLKNSHPLGALLSSCEGYVMSMKRGVSLTSKQAQKAEVVGQNVNSTQKFLENKYGRSK